MATTETKELRCTRVVRRFQDKECATGEVKLVDEEGNVWRPRQDDVYISGNTYGRQTGNIIWINE